MASKRSRRRVWYARRVAGALALLGLVLATVVMIAQMALGAVEMPTLPDPSKEMLTQMGACPDGPNLWRTFYDLTGDGRLAELVTYGRAGSEQPLLWLYFAPDEKGEIVRIVLTLPGQPAEEITEAQLEARFPSFCDLPTPT